MRLLRISLATKYRILFGLAVIAIISAALAVPWYRMESLLLGQPYREAQRMVQDYFQFVIPDKAMGTGQGRSVHGGEFGLLPPDRQREQPRFVRLEANPSELESLSAAVANDPFIAKAVRSFLKNPRQSSVYADVQEDGVRRFRYAHAVRASKGCLGCHAEAKTARPYQENQLAGIVAVDLPADVGWEGVWLNRLVVVAAGALAGTLAILVFYVITQKFILAPIHELRQVTIRVADGELEVRSHVQTGDEFEQLSHNLNTMLERLRNSQQELERANRLLDQKLGEMAESNVALYEANRLKSEFLASVSHELRTPLTSIIGFAELLREGPHLEDGSRAARYAENILISGRILLEIINDLLDLAKIEAGKMELHIEAVDVCALCRTLADFVRPMAGNKELRAEFHAEAGLPVVRTDQSKLRQILFNLLSNAVKFTPEGGQVCLTARAVDRDQVELAVTDTGPGIAPDDHEWIFEKFRQVDQSATREHHGTGLGLAIAKELTHLLGGEIGVESTLGAGARFWVRLPAEVSAPRERRLVSLV